MFGKRNSWNGIFRACACKVPTAIVIGCISKPLALMHVTRSNLPIEKNCIAKTNRKVVWPFRCVSRFFHQDRLFFFFWIKLGQISLHGKLPIIKANLSMLNCVFFVFFYLENKSVDFFRYLEDYQNNNFKKVVLEKQKKSNKKIEFFVSYERQ